MNIEDLQQLSNKIRINILKSLFASGSGHTGGPLGMADILTALYFHTLNHRPKEPNWPERDRFVLSCGHSAPALYATLAEASYFPIEELQTLRKLSSRLQGHPHFGELPGIESSSGPLGEGLSTAVGMALAARLDKKNYHIYCLTSDGEHDEGQIWEAYMLAAKNKLSNLTVIIDRNNIQIDGYTEDIMPLEPLKNKLESFNIHVLEVDGNSIGHLIDAFHQAQSYYDGPTAIIARTIPGKGVDFMENQFSWHGKTPNEEELKNAISQLERL